jgi:hypothetical protein
VEAALNGFNMNESPLVREWKDAAKLEGKIEWLLHVVKGKFRDSTEEVSTGIRECRDLEKLHRWLDVA